MTQFEYERLLSTLAKALSTQRRYVRLVRSVELSDGNTAHIVDLRAYRYCVTLRGDKIIEVAREISAV